MFKPERRNVAVVFADIKGFTTLSEFLDPEDLQELIDGIFREFRNIIESNGGYLDKIIGDAVMAVFGVPVSKGDDVRRALVTALEMQEYLRKVNRERNIEINMRVGVNYGEVLWSSIAGEKPTVLGDTVNVAQRVEEIAEPGKVYVTENVFNLAFKNFEFKEVGWRKLKGREEPVRVFELVGEKKEERAFFIRGRFLTPFVGREKEVALLLNWIKSHEEVGNFIVNIYGEPGTGKSRFCMEFSNYIKGQLENAATIFITCDPIKGQPFYVLRRLLGDIVFSVLGTEPDKELLRNYLVTRRKMAFITADLLSERAISFLKGDIRVLSELGTEFFLQFTEILKNLLVNFSRLFVFVDDAQYMDRESLTLLEKLKSFNFGITSFWFLISREMLKEVKSDLELLLSGLGREFIREVCRVLFGFKDGNISEEFLSYVEERTKGNPYFVEEFLYYLKSRDLVNFDPLRLKSEVREIPETIAGLLVEVVDSLPESCRETLKSASVVGRNFWKGLLGKVLNRKVDEDLDFLVKEGLVFPSEVSFLKNDEEFTFKSELLMEAAYSLLTKKERERIHRLLAEELQRVEDKDEHILSLIGYHFEKAGDLEKSYEFYELSGEMAFSKGYHLYALKAYEHVPLTPSTAYKMAQCLVELGEFDRALQLLNEKMGELKEDISLKFKYEILLSTIYEKLAQFDKAMKHLENALSSEDPEISSFANYRLAFIHWRKGDGKKAEEFVKESLRTIEEYSLSSREALKTLGACFNLLGLIYYSAQGSDRLKSLEYFEKALLIFEEIGDNLSKAKILLNLSQFYIEVKKYEEAKQYLNEALESIKKSGSRFLLAIALNNMGRIYYTSRELEKAREYFAEAWSLFKSLKLYEHCVTTLLNLTGISLDLLDINSAQVFLHEVSQFSENLSGERLALFHLLNGIFLYRRGEFDASEESLQKAMEYYSACGDLNRVYQIYTYLSSIAFLSKDCGEALHYIECAQGSGVPDYGSTRVLETEVMQRAVEFLCKGSLNEEKFSVLNEHRDDIYSMPLEARLLWTGMLRIYAREKLDLDEVLKDKELLIRLEPENYPVFTDKTKLFDFLSFCKSHGAHLLKRFLEKVNGLIVS